MLLPHLSWQDRGRQCTVGKLLRLLFAAAAQRCSLSAICARCRDAPSDQAVRNALVAWCPRAEALEQQSNASFALQLPDSVLKRGRWPLAIDVTLKPYHGQPHRHEREIYRSQPKSGTSHFHAQATCYPVKHGRRYTVALCRVERGTRMEAVLQRLLHYAAEAGVRPSLLLLDRGFYSVDVIRYLQIALLLRNVWVWIHWVYLSTPRRGGRRINLDRLRFRAMLSWLVQFAEETFGINAMVVAEQPDFAPT